MRIVELAKLLMAALFLGDREAYDCAKELIGNIESDNYYYQKWDLAIHGADLGDLHSASKQFLNFYAKEPKISIRRIEL